MCPVMLPVFGLSGALAFLISMIVQARGSFDVFPLLVCSLADYSVTASLALNKRVHLVSCAQYLATEKS